jgi:hypothetical protein
MYFTDTFNLYCFTVTVTTMISHFEFTVLFFTHYSIYLTLIFRYLASSGLQLHSFLVETYNIYDYYRINSITK